MRLIRAWQLFVDIIWLPIWILGGIAGGVAMACVAWWGSVKLAWGMRDSDYSWENSPAESVNIDKKPEEK